MKTIGLIGGMSWESSLEYYRIINETTKQKLGGLHSAKCLMYSVDFCEIEELQRRDRWDDAAQLMIDAAQRLERGGADFVVICTNTMHKSVDAMLPKLHVPLLHIADATARKVKAEGIRRIGLLGTRFTMEHDFYKGRLVDRFDLAVVIPNDDEREMIHRVIYDELCQGIIKPESRDAYIRAMDNLVKQGAEGIILGCTEIESLVRAEDSRVPLFPTAKIHAVAAVEY
ncbi:MAG: aspartate/glutamate racemase family protein, partial [Anaerolineales bacterium]|nr:aspartate/glutamate racemase family protein [Anaerolineales bacterium]